MTTGTCTPRRDCLESSATRTIETPICPRTSRLRLLATRQLRTLLVTLSMTVVASLLLPADRASGHHSPAVFDRSRQITITGVVREFRWGNPHSWIHLDVSDDDGNAATWSVEMDPAMSLARSGWTRRTIEPGDQVEIRVYPLRNDEKGGQYISLTLPDGSAMDEDTPQIDVVGP